MNAKDASSSFSWDWMHLHTCIQSIMRAGGYFFGTFPSGKRVQEVIHRGGTWPVFKAPMLELKALWKGDVGTFGSAYTCAIGDTVTAGKL